MANAYEYPTENRYNKFIKHMIYSSCQYAQKLRAVPR